MRRALAAALDDWLLGRNEDSLVYEPTYGGLVYMNIPVPDLYTRVRADVRTPRLYILHGRTPY